MYVGFTLGDRDCSIPVMELCISVCTECSVTQLLLLGVDKLIISH